MSYATYENSVQAPEPQFPYGISSFNRAAKELLALIRIFYTLLFLMTKYRVLFFQQAH